MASLKIVKKMCSPKVLRALEVIGEEKSNRNIFFAVLFCHSVFCVLIATTHSWAQALLMMSFAVSSAAWWGGYFPAIICTAASSVTCALLMPPAHELVIHDRLAVTALCIFVIHCLILCCLAEVRYYVPTKEVRKSPGVSLCGETADGHIVIVNAVGVTAATTGACWGCDVVLPLEDMYREPATGLNLCDPCSNKYLI